MIHNEFILGEMGGTTAADQRRFADEVLRYENRRRKPTVTGSWQGSEAGSELTRRLVELGLIDDQTSVGIAPSVNDHGLTPTIVANANLGTTGTATITGHDSDGMIEFVPGGSSIAAGDQAAVTFVVARSSGNYAVQLTPLSSAAAALSAPILRATSRTATGFTLARATTALVTGTTYQWTYTIRGY